MSRKKQRGPNGGFRPGSGRPRGSKNKKTIKQEEARQFILDKILEHLEPLIETQMRLALGEVYVDAGKKKKFVDESGKEIVTVYKKPPNQLVIQGLMEMLVGKAVQPILGKGLGTDPQSPSLSTSVDQLTEQVTSILTPPREENK